MMISLSADIFFVIANELYMDNDANTLGTLMRVCKAFNVLFRQYYIKAKSIMKITGKYVSIIDEYPCGIRHCEYCGLIIQNITLTSKQLRIEEPYLHYCASTGRISLRYVVANFYYVCDPRKCKGYRKVLDKK
jgi:hypothetical protein